MARLLLCLLGPLRITLDGQPVSGFAYTKARALLAYLVAEAGRPHHRDALVGLLWPELSDTSARTNLRQVLANLRQVIGDDAAMPPFLLITRDTIQFNSSSDYDLDVAAFTTLLSSCTSHIHRHVDRCRTCATRMEQALTLYCGDFLTEFTLGDSAPFEEWQLLQREQLHRQALDALRRLADYHERRGDDELARHYAQRQIELDSWREEAHRQLMRLLARGGQRSAALAQYEVCRHVLARDLGVAPAAETMALYECIRDGSSSEVRVLISKLPIQIRETQYSNAQRAPETQSWHNLPAQTTPLIGRETELMKLGALLENPTCRLITIVGPGGIGKTRLALAAAEQAEMFTHGVAFVPIVAISSAAFLASAILAALNVALPGQRDQLDQLLDYLREKELLLVLDNVEQLLRPDLPLHALGNRRDGGAVELLVNVLHYAPGVTLLITARERLALQGEWLFELSGLNYPIGKSIDDLEGYSAVQLFLQRASQERRHFALTEAEAPAIARICQLVEGLPLAIELAAAGLRQRSCTAIATAIETRLSTLATTLRNVPERHRSMWATFEYSWRLLSDAERQVFPRLSVFRGGFQEDAAAQVAQADSELLAALVDRSLLRWDGIARYDMHELTRQYASEKLEQAGIVEDTRNYHTAYFLALAERAEPKLQGEEQIIWLNRLELEHDNLRTVLRRGRTAENDMEIVVRLAGTLWLFWILRGYGNEGREWLADVLSRSDAKTTAYAKALNSAGNLAEVQGDYAAGRALFEESLAISRTLGDKCSIAYALSGLGRVAKMYHDYTRTTALLEESLVLFRELGDTWGTARSVNTLGYVAYAQGDYLRAAALFAESLALWRNLGVKSSIAWGLHSLGYVAYAQGDYLRAAALFAESLALRRELEDKLGIAACLEGLAGVVEAEGHPQRAIRLFAASQALREISGGQVDLSDRVEPDYNLAAGYAQLDNDTFAVAWAAGQAMSLEQAIAYALDGSEAGSRSIKKY